MICNLIKKSKITVEQNIINKLIHSGDVQNYMNIHSIQEKYFRYKK